jgi:4-amino-4-deoxy-L-arabinose transferase-like glycosyltransferase
VKGGRPRTSLWLWLNALALGLGAQYLLANGRGAEGRWLYALAVGAGLVALALAARGQRAERPPASQTGAPPPGWRAALAALLGAGLLASALCAGLAASQAHHAALGVWLTALGGLAVATGASQHNASPARPAALTAAGPAPAAGGRPAPPRLPEALLVAALLGLALALRLPSLDTIPREVHGDEAAIGLEARRLLAGEAPTIFAVGWYDVPMISFAIPAIVMAAAGQDLFGLRLASVLQGVGSILLLYLLARRLFGRRTAALAAFLLTVSQWHLHFSRGGFHYMQAVLAGLLLLYLLQRALDSGRWLDYLLAGYAGGLCLTVYYAARLFPLLATGYLLAWALARPARARRQTVGLAVLLLGALVFLAPTAAGMLRNPRAFVSRAEGVWLFTPRNLQHELAAYKVDSPRQVLAIQLRRTLEAFSVGGESSLQYSHPAPLVDFWTGVLAIVGVGGLTLLATRRSNYLLVAGWLWLTLLIGSVLTVDAPFSPRLVGVMPAVMLTAALFLETGWRQAERAFGRAGRFGGGLLSAGLLALALATNIRDYFGTHVNQHQPPGFFTVLSSYVGSINDDYRVYLVGRPDTSLAYDTPRFLLPDLDGADLRDRPLPLAQIPSEKGVAFLVEQAAPDRAQRIAAIKRAYPTAREERIKSVNGADLFTSLRVDRPALETAAPNASRDPAPPARRWPPPPDFPYRVEPIRPPR